MKAGSRMRVTVMAGGTGGHVYPALAVARKLREADAEVRWLGSRRGMEARIVPAAGFPVDWIRIGGVRGKGPWTWLSAPLRIVWACGQAAGALLKYRPHVVLGMGGFVAGPGGVMAWLLRIPLVIHEQNSVAGLTNRILARFARAVLEAFPGSFGTSVAAVHTGNPVREDILAVSSSERDRPRDGRLRLLVVGGSLGARILNETVPAALARLAEADRPRVLHQAGKTTLDLARRAYRDHRVDAQVVEFIEDMAMALARADLVICRAGALTVSELAAVGVAGVLVPFPHAVDDHQTGNARYLAEAGAAVLLPQLELTAQRLAALVQELMTHPETLRRMAARAREKAMPGATEAVVAHCRRAAGWDRRETGV